MVRGTWLQLTIAVMATSMTGACVVNEPEAPPRGVVVSGPPPPPVREERPPPPSGPGAAQASWVAGYWHWTGMQYAWVPGHWENPPSRTAVWAAPEVKPTSDGRYIYEAGGWKPANGQALR